MNILTDITKGASIRNALLELGVPANIRGFMYIVYAEQLIQQNQEYMIGITKLLYRDIAKEFMTSPSAVERCIRTAIIDGWKVAPDEVKTKFFGNSIRQGKTVPTNGQFLVVLYHYINLH